MLSLSSFAFSQSKLEDVVYLKNGSILRGKITEQRSDGMLKIELSGGSVFVLQKAEVDSIKKESALKNRLRELNRNYYRRDRGFRNITEFSLLYGPGSTTNPNNYYYNGTPDDFGLSLHTVNGYQFWPYLFTGIGIGIDRFATYQQTFSPFYVRLSSEFLKKRVTPYLFLDAGYSVMWKEKNTDYIAYRDKGGLYISTGAGVRIYTRTRASVTLSAGYKRNNSQTTWWYTPATDNTYYYTIARTYQRLVISVGVTF